jgi:hypothetical protein
VPPLDPPFTDELADFSVSPGVQLAFDLSGRPPGGPTQPPTRQRVQQSQRQQDAPAAGRHEMPPDALAGASPDARRAARRFLAATVEIINGFRPVSHARQLAGAKQASAVCVQLTAAVERARAVNRPPGADRGRGPQPSRPGPAPSRPGAPPRDQRRAELLRVRQLRVCEPVPGVVESAVVLGTSSRSCALMFRLERQGDSGAWLGTDVQLI